MDVTDVRVNLLLPADSPRLAGEDSAHTRALAEVDAPLPPILVHRPTMRVIDGMHRWRAAQARAAQTIEARFFDGDDDAAFVLAVEANIEHGLPLSLADRKAAATRIVRSHPEWSDRAIARTTGLGARTVQEIRRCASAGLPQLHARLGLDGRVRPMSSVEGRRLAGEVIAARPEASLRQIARIAGISPGTARDVRERVRQGKDPVPERMRGNDGGTDTAPARTGPRAIGPADKLAVVRTLKRDPALRFTESGRSLLRWLDGQVSALDYGSNLSRAVPPHCVNVVAELARACAEEWQNIAEELTRRGEITA